MTGFKSWFNARSVRERRLLLVMAALLVLTIVWAGVIRPLGDGLSGARERYADAVLRLGTVEDQVDAIRRANADRPRPLTGTLADVVRQEAEGAGFTLASLDEQGPGRVSVGIQSAKAGALAGWLARLERRGVLVDSATMTNNGDRTVGVSLTLKARGA